MTDCLTRRLIDCLSLTLSLSLSHPFPRSLLPRNPYLQFDVASQTFGDSMKTSHSRVPSTNDPNSLDRLILDTKVRQSAPLFLTSLFPPYLFLPSFPLLSFLSSFLPSFLFHPYLLPSFTHSLLPCFLPCFLPSFFLSFFPSFLPSIYPYFLPFFLASFSSFLSSLIRRLFRYIFLLCI